MTTAALRGINCTAKASTGAPSAGTWAVGDLVCDSAGTYYVCTAAGTPGTWTALAAGGTPILWGKPNATVAVTTTSSATANAHHFVQPGSDITITLPAAASNNGTVCAFEMRSGATAIQATLDAGAGVLIAGRTRYLALVNTNVVMLYCNGTDWVPMILCLDTPWIDGGAITITATTTNPNKGNSGSPPTDRLWWRRVGDSLEFQLRYAQTNATGATDGSGQYLFAVPFSIDTAVHPLYTGTSETITEDAQYVLPGSNGSRRSAGAGTSFLTVLGVIPYSATTVRVLMGLVSDGTSSGGVAYHKSASGGLNVSNIGWTYSAKAKITNW